MSHNNDYVISNDVDDTLKIVSKSVEKSKNGKFLYGDYSGYEENRNILDTIKDYVAIITSIIQIHKNIQDLNNLSNSLSSFQNEIISKIFNLKNNLIDSVQIFNNEHLSESSNLIHDKLNHNEIFPNNILLDPINNLESEYSKYFDEYYKYINQKITNYYGNSIVLLHTWLSKWKNNLPPILLSNIFQSINIILDEPNNEKYKIISSFYCNIPQNGLKLFDDEKLNSLSYSFLINSSFMSFWSVRKKLSDIYSTPLLLPIKFKVPISKRLKRSLKLVSGNEENKKSTSDQEPEIAIFDNYYLTNIILEKNKRIFIRLSNDPNKNSEKILEMNYNLEWSSPDEHLFTSENLLKNDELYSKLINSEGLPEISYIHNSENKTLNLFEKEFLPFVNVQQIINLGKLVAEKIDYMFNDTSKFSLTDHSNLLLIQLNNKINIIKMHENSFTSVDDSSDIMNRKIDSLLYDQEMVIRFLEFVAYFFSDIIIKLKEKSPLKDEIMLRYEEENKPREEYVLKLSDLNNSLSETSSGKRIFSILNRESNTIY